MIAAPAGTKVIVEYDDDQIIPLTVIAFDEHGRPLVIPPGDYRQQLWTVDDLEEGVRGWRLREPPQGEGTTVRAEPGWYALGLVDYATPEKLPVIAWCSSTPSSRPVYGTAQEPTAIIMAPNSRGGFIPWIANAYFLAGRHDLVGFFHPEHHPEDADTAELIQARRDTVESAPF